MSQNKTKRELIQEQLSKIHELRMNKLFTIERIQKESQDTATTLRELDTKLAEIQTDLLSTTPKIETKRALILIKLIAGRKSILTGYNGIIKECRLIFTTLVKEEGKIQFELASLEAET